MEIRARATNLAERRTRCADVPPVERLFADALLMEQLQQAIAQVVAPLADRRGDPYGRASQLLQDFVARPGKRVRPYLCVVGYDLGAGAGAGPRPPGVLQFAAALEALHAFLLVHDDVADRAHTRRGEPSLHVLLRPAPTPLLTEGDRQRLGNDLAVVAGDLLYTRALEAMLSAPGLAPARLLPAMHDTLAVCRSTAEGQFNDIAFSARPLRAVQAREVLDVYRLKTGRYTFEGPLVAGAHLAGAGEEMVEALRRFALGAGVAFQLEDDLLGLFAGEEETGKPALADLREAKKTWPLLAAYAGASEIERQWLEELFARGDATERDLGRVRSLVRRTGALAEAHALLADCLDDAERALHPLAGHPAVAELVVLVHWLRSRADAWT